MLYSASRLGSLSTDLTRFDFRKAALGLTVAVAMGVTAWNPAAAQQVTRLNAQQCENANSIANALMERNIGKISSQLAASFQRFRISNCDMNTDWDVVSKDDERVFGEFRVRLVALTTAASSNPQTLARQ